jgi:hypothetical protein
LLCDRRRQVKLQSQQQQRTPALQLHSPFLVVFRAAGRRCQAQGQNN